MSYDISIGDGWFNYTSNMRQFFIDFGVYPPNWNGEHRYEVASQIEAALDSIRANDIETLKTEYDAPNGWGAVENAIDWLEKVREACVKELPDTVKVSY